MPVPFNLLNSAMSAVGKQKFSYLKFVSRVTNDVGEFVPTYSLPVALSGQVQAVPRELFEKYGLEFQGTYLMFYVSKEILDIERDVSGDQIKFGGATYQCLSETDWFQINGWTGVIAVRI